MRLLSGTRREAPPQVPTAPRRAVREAPEARQAFDRRPSTSYARVSGTLWKKGWLRTWRRRDVELWADSLRYYKGTRFVGALSLDGYTLDRGDHKRHFALVHATRKRRDFRVSSPQDYVRWTSAIAAILDERRPLISDDFQGATRALMQDTHKKHTRAFRRRFQQDNQQPRADDIPTC